MPLSEIKILNIKYLDPNILYRLSFSGLICCFNLRTIKVWVGFEDKAWKSE